MELLVQAISIYRMDYRGFHGEDGGPQNLAAAVARADLATRYSVCPGHRVNTVGAENEGMSLGYRYIDWWSRSDASGVEIKKFPMIYDAALSNHGGLGVNVVLVDGTIFWDQNAVWLAQFNRQHPQHVIALPIR